MDKLTKLPPPWHQEAAGWINTNFEAINTEFVRGAKKAAMFGMFIVALKAKGKADGSIPHGQFEAWREKWCPTISARQLQSYAAQWRELAETLRITTGEVIACAERKQLPEKAEAMVEGKTQRQLMLHFREMREVDGELEPRVGRAGGSGGSRRLSTAEKAAAAELEARRVLCLVTRELNALGGRFAVLPDDVLHVFAGFLADSQKLINGWLTTPAGQRDIGAVEKQAAKNFKSSAALRKVFGV